MVNMQINDTSAFFIAFCPTFLAVPKLSFHPLFAKKFLSLTIHGDTNIDWEFAVSIDTVSANDRKNRISMA